MLGLILVWVCGKGFGLVHFLEGFELVFELGECLVMFWSVRLCVRLWECSGVWIVVGYIISACWC